MNTSCRRKVRRAEDQGLEFYEASSPDLTGAQPRECLHGDSAFLQDPLLKAGSWLLSRVRGWS